MGKYIAGLLIGMVFGFLLKKSRFCLTGLTRDIYLEKRGYNFILMIAIISTEGFVYHALGHAGIVRIPSYLPPFSLVSVAAGSFLFGLGAVMANGCLTSTLVKCGDGRINGIISLVTVMAVGYFFSAGAGAKITDALRSYAIVDDDLIVRRTMLPVYLFAVLAIASYILMYKHHKAHRLRFRIPGRYTGVRHVILEKVWPTEIAAVLIGLLMGMTFAVSGRFGRHHGFAVATPILSWVYAVTKPEYITGGCNPFDQRFGFGSMFVLGIVLGVLGTTVMCGEYSVVMPRRDTVLRTVTGSALMAAGAMWGMGCLLVNVLVGTSQFSLKSFYAVPFLIAGIWCGTKIFIKGRTSR